MSVFGTRPQLVKLSAIWLELEKTFRSRLVDSGQHYDYELAGAFYAGKGIREPDAHLGVKSYSPARQIGRVADALDGLLAKWKPAAVVIFGDTSTTAGAAVAAAYRNIPTAHVEAGLRSYDHSMPEEKNRILADHLSTWRFCPTGTAVANLRAEGIVRGVLGTGDIMFESFRSHPLDTGIPVREFGCEPGQYLFVTCHRAENVDSADRLGALTRILTGLPCPAIFAVHPRARKNLIRHGFWKRLRLCRALRLTPPLDHATTLALVASSRAVLTDSGGLQREAYWSRVPCLILRDRTEWVELVRCGASILVDLDERKVTRVLRTGVQIQPIEDRIFRFRHPSQKIAARLQKDLRSG